MQKKKNLDLKYPLKKTPTTTLFTRWLLTGDPIVPLNNALCFSDESGKTIKNSVGYLDKTCKIS